MGMFDNLRVLCPLPDCPREPATMDFQTKSFDCTMDDVILTEGFELRHDEWECESVPKEERPYPTEDGPLGIVGSLRRKVLVSDVKLDFSGVVFFYDSLPNPALPHGREYVHYFALVDRGDVKIILRRDDFEEEEEALPALKLALAQKLEEARLQSAIPQSQLPTGEKSRL